jgi:hypothetical protein
MKTTITVKRTYNTGKNERDVVVFIDYRMTGRHISAGETDPEEWPELDIESAVNGNDNRIDLNKNEIMQVYEKVTAAQNEEDFFGII